MLFSNTKFLMWCIWTFSYLLQIHGISHSSFLEMNSTSWALVLDSFKRIVQIFLGKAKTEGALIENVAVIIPTKQCLESLRCGNLSSFSLSLLPPYLLPSLPSIVSFTCLDDVIKIIVLKYPCLLRNMFHCRECLLLCLSTSLSSLSLLHSLSPLPGSFIFFLYVFTIFWSGVCFRICYIFTNTLQHITYT